MQRLLEYALISWKDKGPRSPILIRGARQVGKTYLVENFAKKHFKSIVNINFDLQTEYKACFETLKPKEINSLISAISRQTIIPGETLLFLDEIQACPNAIMALRYYKEQMPELHVIAAGSLLEFVIQTEAFSMPVGRVISLYLKPMSFKEFLLASNYTELLSIIETANINTVLNASIVALLEKLLRIYFVTGGMPAVLKNYLELDNLTQTQILQLSLLKSFQDDFGKYATTSQHKYLRAIFDKAPGFVAEHVKYSNIDPNMQARDLKEAIQTLNYAGLIYPIYATNGTGLPLNSLINQKRFKLLFLDIGLAKATSNIDAELMLNKDLMLVNQGKLVEQFVGQELLTLTPPYQSGELFYWERPDKKGSAEVDYIINIDDQIFPVEVKSGKTGTLRSMHYFLQHVNTNSKLGIRISMQPLGFGDNILNIPLYMLSELHRLVSEAMRS